MVKMCSTWPLLNKCALLKKRIEVGLQTPPSPRTPYIVYGKGQKFEIWILFLPWSLKQKLDVIYWPYGRVLSLKWLFLVRNGNFFTFGCCGVRKTLQIFLNVLSVPFRLIGIHFDHYKIKILIVNFCLFHRLYRGSEVTVGSEDTFQFFFKEENLFKRGQVEHVLTMANLKIKPSLSTPRPSSQSQYNCSEFG